MRGYFWQWTGRWDIFETRIAPSMEALEEKVAGKEVFPDDVCHDMNLVLKTADDLLAGGDGSVPLKNPWGRYTIDQMLEKRGNFHRLYKEHLLTQKEVTGHSVPEQREAEILDEFQGGFKDISTTVDDIYLEYDTAIQAMQSSSSGF